MHFQHLSLYYSLSLTVSMRTTRKQIAFREGHTEVVALLVEYIYVLDEKGYIYMNTELHRMKFLELTKSGSSGWVGEVYIARNRVGHKLA